MIRSKKAPLLEQPADPSALSPNTLELPDSLLTAINSPPALLRLVDVVVSGFFN
jgi:hypothetical protein